MELSQDSVNTSDGRLAGVALNLANLANLMDSEPLRPDGCLETLYKWGDQILHHLAKGLG
ncbi:MAG TPA: hypothetical protein V6D46_08490 [Coleofasciculaceae cyanobacterium]